MTPGEYAILERGDCGWHTVASFKAYGPDTIQDGVGEYVAEATGVDGPPLYGRDFLVVSVLPELEALAGVNMRQDLACEGWGERADERREERA
jgi:hypothetical protein